jgi:hypothetical protein
MDADALGGHERTVRAAWIKIVVTANFKRVSISLFLRGATAFLRLNL